MPIILNLSNPEDFKNHIEICGAVKVILCPAPECRRKETIFGAKDSFRKHLQHHSKIDKDFFSKLLGEKMLQLCPQNRKNEVFKCPKCGRMFKDKEKFLIHTLIHGKLD